jgi:hypothetical protein
MTRLEHSRGDHARAAALADDALALFDRIRQTVKRPCMMFRRSGWKR